MFMSFWVQKNVKLGEDTFGKNSSNCSIKEYTQHTYSYRIPLG